MKSLKYNFRPTLLLIIRCLIAMFAISLLVYCISDIFTSRQTYFYNGEDRSISKISLVLLLIISLLISALSFVYDKKSTIAFFKKTHYLTFSFFLIGIVVSLSGFLNKNSFNTLGTYLIYIVSIYLFIVSFSLISKLNFIEKRYLVYGALFFFYLYLCLCCFFFFYTLGKPMSSGNLRYPIISHIFFPCSLIPFFHRVFPLKKMSIIYISFLPVAILANKMSVLIIFVLYVFYDLFESSFLISRPKVRRIILIVLIGFVTLIVLIANFTKNNFLSNNLSFSAVFLESGRIQNWYNILSDLQNFRFIDFFIGKGVEGTITINNGTAAHNDFVEYLYDFGVVGFLFLLLFMLSISLYIWKSDVIKTKQDKCLLLFYIFMFSFISTMFSNGMFFLFLTIGIECYDYKFLKDVYYGVNYGQIYWSIDI